ncbi:MAG: GNAT family N-acetyltransferase [Flavobacteriaceae bacterium]|jgi:putative acetyltransferase|nr:GNAT family N-acetyltransferase [Flavobacteriaceae bacterium]|tara:strand:+ start:3763 stop:4242 length:480 start_codon:yes stop_codon:yes gene_type:complete
MLIRPINQSDNKSLSVILREVLVEMQIPKIGSAYEDPELDDMFNTYQLPRSQYFVVQEGDRILGGAGISPLRDGDANICELQKMYFNKSLRGRGIGQKMIQICIDFAVKSDFDKCYIETMPNMIKAQKLYIKQGFKYIDSPLGNTGHNACPIWMIKEIR